MNSFAGSEYGPGILAFLIVAGLGLALYFLIKSMNKQLGKIDLPRNDEPDDHQSPNA